MRERNKGELTMIPAIIIISLAFAWLLYETDWLRVNLMSISPDELLLDIEAEFDGSDSDYYMDYNLQYQEDVDYYQWLKNYYAPKPSLLPAPNPTCDPRDKWMVIRDDLQARRNGEAIYQRGH